MGRLDGRDGARDRRRTGNRQGHRTGARAGGRGCGRHIADPERDRVGRRGAEGAGAARRGASRRRHEPGRDARRGARGHRTARSSRRPREQCRRHRGSSRARRPAAVQSRRRAVPGQPRAESRVRLLGVPRGAPAHARPRLWTDHQHRIRLREEQRWHDRLHGSQARRGRAHAGASQARWRPAGSP